MWNHVNYYDMKAAYIAFMTLIKGGRTEQYYFESNKNKLYKLTQSRVRKTSFHEYSILLQ